MLEKAFFNSLIKSVNELNEQFWVYLESNVEPFGNNSTPKSRKTTGRLLFYFYTLYKVLVIKLKDTNFRNDVLLNRTLKIG